MKTCEGRIGRVFVIKLEDGDILPECIERFAEEKGISVGQVILLGGIKSGRLVVGPKRSEKRPPQTTVLSIKDTHELAAVGVLAPNEEGKPVLHIHGTLGRSGKTIGGCLRLGVTTWLIGEVILCEIIGADVKRTLDKENKVVLLNPGANRSGSIH